MTKKYDFKGIWHGKSQEVNSNARMKPNAVESNLAESF